MRLRPEEESRPQYPTLRDHKNRRGTLLRLAAGVGLGAALTTAASAKVGPRIRGRIAAPAVSTPAKEAPAAKTDLAKTLAAAEKQVAELVKQLGSSTFKTREAATAGLIALGKGAGKCKATDARVRQIVTAGMQGCAKHKDPEIRTRAKVVLVALTPPKNLKRPPIRGVIAIKGDIAVEPPR